MPIYNEINEKSMLDQYFEVQRSCRIAFIVKVCRAIPVIPKAAMFKHSVQLSK